MHRPLKRSSTGTLLHTDLRDVVLIALAPELVREWRACTWETKELEFRDGTWRGNLAIVLCSYATTARSEVGLLHIVFASPRSLPGGCGRRLCCSVERCQEKRHVAFTRMQQYSTSFERSRNATLVRAQASLVDILYCFSST